MYTKCPECQIAFQVTAKVLQQASGMVRCGGCSNAFNALDFLSEDLPTLDARSDERAHIAPEDETILDDDDFTAQTNALLETLEELAGPEDIRIEDTGVEWRVLDDDADENEPLSDFDDTSAVPILPDPDQEDIPEIIAEISAEELESAARQSIELASEGNAAVDPGEMRFDDNTPIPEDFDELAERVYSAQRDSAQIEISDTPETVQEDLQEDLELGEPEEWVGLLDEVDVPQEDAAGADAEEPQNAPADVGFSMDESPTADIPLYQESAVRDDAEPGDASGEDLAGAHDEVDEAANYEFVNEEFVAQLIEEASEESGTTDAEPEEDEAVEASNEQEAALALDKGGEAEHDEAETETQEEAAAAFEEAGDDRELALDKDPDATDLNKQLRESTGAFEQKIAIAEAALRRELGDESELAPEDLADEISAVSENLASEIDAITEAASRHELGDDSEAPPEDLADESSTGTENLASEKDAIAALADARALDADDEHAEEATDEDAPAAADAGTLDADDEHAEETRFEDKVTAAEAAKIEVDEDLESSDDAAAVGAAPEKTIGGVPASLLESASDNVETIVMEGEFVRGSLEFERRASDQLDSTQFEDPDALVDTYAMQRGKLRGGRRNTDPPGLVVIAGVALLAITLLFQVVHANRETLSTYSGVNQTLGPLYRFLGDPVTPHWNIKGWQFEATNSATDDNEQVLTVFSRIVNRAEQALPYPLVHVSLMDRWEEIIGSRVLEPNDYLAGDLDPSKPVAAGEDFTAVITIASLSPNATGFKLNVCYRVAPGRVRCATEDFKD